MTTPSSTSVNTSVSDKPSLAFVLSHALSLNGGPMLIQAAVSTYFLVFMTDTMMIAASSAAVIMLIASLWDVFNDPIMGVVADKTDTRWGRYRPYFLFTPVIYTIFAILLFLNPEGLSSSQKLIYIGVVYLGFGTLFTVLTMPQMAILPAVTRDNKVRNRVITIGAIFMASSFTIANMSVPKLQEMANGSYVPAMAIFGVLGIIAFLVLFFSSEEKYLEPADSNKTKKSDWKKELLILFKHKEIYFIGLVWVCASAGFALMFGSSVYYVKYFLARPDLIGKYMTIISMGSLVSMAILMPIVLRLFKKGHKALLVTQGITFCFYLVCYFSGGTSMNVLFVASFLATAFGGMSMGLINILVNDLIDFVQTKDGLSMNGTIASLKGFCQKLGQTAQNAGVLAFLGAVGYIAGAIGNQPDSVMVALNVIRFGIPAILCLVVVLVMAKYPLKAYIDGTNDE